MSSQLDEHAWTFRFIFDITHNFFKNLAKLVEYIVCQQQLNFKRELRLLRKVQPSTWKYFIEFTKWS